MGLSLRPNLGATKSKATRSAAGISSPEPAADEAAAPSALNGEGSCGPSGLAPLPSGCVRGVADGPAGARRDAASNALVSATAGSIVKLSRAARTGTSRSRGAGVLITIALGGALGACATVPVASGTDTSGGVNTGLVVGVAVGTAPAPAGVRATRARSVDDAGGPPAGGPPLPRKAGPASSTRRPV